MPLRAHTLLTLCRVPGCYLPPIYRVEFLRLSPKDQELSAFVRDKFNPYTGQKMRLDEDSSSGGS